MSAAFRSALERFDHAAMLAVARRRHPIVTGVLRALTWTGEGRWWAAIVLVLAAGIRFDFLRFPHREFTLFATLAPGVSWIFVKALKVFWRRRRPFQVLENYPGLTPAPLDDSFPSGHTASVFAFLVAMSPIGPVVAALLALWAGVVAFSRYYLGVHFPSDILVGALIGTLAGAGLVGVHSAYGADKYASYTELAQHEKEGTDYVVETRDRHSRVLVLAIHGQNIEPGSDDVAEAIARADCNEYIFRALKNENWEDLHVTSSRFDDPRALDLAARSRLCVSVHGYRERAKEAVCLGGGNEPAIRRVALALKRNFPEIERLRDCDGLGGADPKNIVNRCREQGVQLELSWKLRERLRKDSGALRAFGKAVRSALQFRN